MSEKFANRLQAWAKDALDIAGRCHNEEQTKLALIVPFFEVLGYDCTRPEVFVAEARAGISVVSFGRADFAIRDEREITIVVECKSAGEKLGVHASQLKRYFDQLTTASIGILTNGHVFNFYLRSEPARCMEDLPFLEFGVEALQDKKTYQEIEDFLINISSKNFDDAAIADFAKKKRIELNLQKWWQKQLLDPSEDLCRTVLQHQLSERITAKVLRSYKEIVTEALVHSMALQVKALLPEIMIDRSGRARFQSTHRSAKSLTSKREYDVFQYCLIILSQATAGKVDPKVIQEVTYRDYNDHFSIYIGGPKDGRILKFYEDSNGGELFEFKDGERCRDEALITDPLVRNFYQALEWHEGRRA